ncbi:MAG TPA: nitrite reductase small subunit NirD [Acidobacteriaceae bacterium]|nr:nitrite reductase small subunit NirD [Acidobacteriaceae bacterium]
MTRSQSWIRVAHAEDIPLREGRAVEIDGRDIAIFNLGERFLAIENRCPHRGGPLADGIVSGGTVVCPLHAWKVHLEEGSVVKPQEHACVATYPVRLDDGIVSIQMIEKQREEALSTPMPECMVIDPSPARAVSCSS